MSAKGYKIGVYVCECGPNIADAVDIDRVIDTVSAYSNVSVVKRHKLLCSGGGKDFLRQDIIDEGLTHVVVAACSPKDHEATFAGVCMESGINPYLYQLINIREQCAWMIRDKKAATDKVISYIRAGVRRVSYHSSLEQKEIDSVPDVLIIGGGIAGIESALNLASPSRKVFLVEKSDKLGGVAGKLDCMLPYGKLDPAIIAGKIEAVKDNENIEVFNNSEVANVIGFFGNFEAVVEKLADEKIDIKIGSVIIATGFSIFDPGQTDKWGYGIVDNVFTTLEIEEKCKTGEALLEKGSQPKSVALVHCVGREDVGYCSGVCCNSLLKIAGSLKEKYPDIKVHDLHQNLCITNPDDVEYIDRLEKGGVIFTRVSDVEISAEKGTVKATYKTESGEEESILVDMAVLAPAMIPGPDTQKISGMLDLPLDEFGFFEEEHVSVGSFKTSVDGVFIAGCAFGPKNIVDSAGQSLAASGNILARLIPGKKLHPEVKVSEVIESLCTGCQTCVTVCSYGATSYDEDKGVSVVNEAICRGCGNCVGSCPSGAIRSKHFTEKQLHQEVIEALLSRI